MLRLVAPISKGLIVICITLSRTGQGEDRLLTIILSERLVPGVIACWFIHLSLQFLDLCVFSTFAYPHQKYYSRFAPFSGISIVYCLISFRRNNLNLKLTPKVVL